MRVCRITCNVSVYLLFLCVNVLAKEYISEYVRTLVKKWAPLVFLAPGEVYYPSSVSDFLDHMISIPYQKNFNTTFDYHEYRNQVVPHSLPTGSKSESWYLVTTSNVKQLLNSNTSFLYGKNPSKHSVPVYVTVTLCSRGKPRKSTYLESNLLGTESSPRRETFHVTYWMFYPYNQGKEICTVDFGLLGPWPIPKLNKSCWGKIKEFGNHVGDWEHMSLSFEGSDHPKAMYVSTHDVGGYYKYSKENNRFEFDKREIRKGVLQRPTFPPLVRLLKPSSHPILYAARGSHGLWSYTGERRFVRIPRLYDYTGQGVPWATWRHVQILDPYKTDRNWFNYRGRWGNPQRNCHPLSRLGLPVQICELSDGPTGIPLKKPNFYCSK